MLRIAARIRLRPEQVTETARSYFGPHGCGMRIADEGQAFLCLEGRGGAVELVACAEENGTTVECTSREWDSQVKEFIREISCKGM